MYESLKKQAFNAIEKNKQEAICLSDQLADAPETSGEEKKSCQAYVVLLKQQGFTVQNPFAGFDYAFSASYGEKRYDKKIALLAEYDALPAIGHACGHCASGASSFLAAVSLAELQESLQANIDLIGTPQEEFDGAKCSMVEQGVFDEYDMAMMVHMSNKNEISPIFIALDGYTFTFHGAPTHAAATPWEGKNALNGVQLLFHAIDMLRQHVKPDVRIHGNITKGGEAPNIVPKEAVASFQVRALERAYLDQVVALVDDCAKGAAIATQTTFEKRSSASSYDNLVQYPAGLSVLAEIFQELGLTVHPSTGSGSSDIGNVSAVIPTFHPMLQIVDEPISLHTVEFANAMKTERTHQAIVTAAQIMVLQILKIFTDENKIKALKSK